MNNTTMEEIKEKFMEKLSRYRYLATAPLDYPGEVMDFREEFWKWIESELEEKTTALEKQREEAIQLVRDIKNQCGEDTSNEVFDILWCVINTLKSNLTPPKDENGK